MADSTDHPENESTRPARRVRRRAGSPAGAPATSAAAEESSTASAPRTTVAAQGAAVEQTTPRPTTTRRRRASAPAGAPAPNPTATDTPQEPGAEPDSAQLHGRTTPETEAAAADAPAEETTAEETPAEGPEAVEEQVETEEPAQGDETVRDEETQQQKPSRRRRGCRATAEAAAPQHVEQDGADAGKDEGIAGDLAALASSHPQPERNEEDQARKEQAQFDLTSLLFQAPTPARSRTTVGAEEASGGSTDIAFDAGRAPEHTAAGDDIDEETTETGTDGGSEEENSEDGESRSGSRRRRRRGGRGRRGRGRGEDEKGDKRSEGDEGREVESASNPDGERPASDSADSDDTENGASGSGSSRRRRRRRRSGSADSDASSPDDPPNTVVKVREGRDEVKAVKGSTRLEAKKQRRREGRDAGRRRQVITEAEFLARRESVKRSMVVRELPARTQIAVLEDDVLVEHYVAQKTETSMVGNVYLGKVQNVLPSMEAAFIDIGRGRNAVLYAGEVNWDAAGLDGQPRRIELALKSGDSVLVQVTKDPIGHKGARLTSQISLPGRYVVFVPGGSMTGISRKLPDTERTRLKKIMKAIIPEEAGVIVRTAAEGASEEELTRDVERLRAQWAKIEKAQKSKSAPAALSREPDLAIKVVRDVFNEDFTSLIVDGEKTYDAVHEYVSSVAPDLLERVTRHVGEKDAFAKHRIDEQLLKAMDRKVYLPSGGSLVIDRTEAMTVVDVNTGKFTGSGGSLEETVTRNNLEAAEEIVRQLRLRDIGGIIVIDFIDMVLESNRDLVLRRLVECLGRDRTKHQVAEVTSLGLVQMTRKRVGQGLVETFSSTCETCNGRGLVVDLDGETPPNQGAGSAEGSSKSSKRRSRRSRAENKDAQTAEAQDAKGSDVHRLQEDESSRALARATIASIAAATTQQSHPEVVVDGQVITVDDTREAGKPSVEPAAESGADAAVPAVEGPAPAEESSGTADAATSQPPAAEGSDDGPQ